MVAATARWDTPWRFSVSLAQSPTSSSLNAIQPESFQAKILIKEEDLDRPNFRLGREEVGRDGRRKGRTREREGKREEESRKK